MVKTSFTFFTVTLRSNSSLHQFRGFLIQARVVGSSPERTTGSFLPPAGTTEFKFHNCDSDNVILTTVLNWQVL